VAAGSGGSEFTSPFLVPLPSASRCLPRKDHAEKVDPLFRNWLIVMEITKTYRLEKSRLAKISSDLLFGHP
jgi:hypothetical protein